MDPLLALIGLTLTATLALSGVWAYQSIASPRQDLRRRISTGHQGFRLQSPDALRRDRRSRLPFVDQLPLSPVARHRMEAELERAGKPLRVNEYLALRLVVATGTSLLVLVLLRASGASSVLVAVGAVVMVLPGWLLPRLYIKNARERRLRQIEEQLPDALTAIAKSLRAGTGLLQAVAYAATETPAPLGTELQSALRDLQLGADASQVFADLSERVGSSDLDIAVTAIVIQRNVGGNLSEILSNTTETIRERANLYREVAVLTARQRLTANLMALIPVLVAAAFILLNPEMGSQLVDTVPGRVSMAIGLAFEALGLVLVRRLARIEV